ncbi:1-deoxy-D-xylulose-5-phosphate synthase [Thiohalophilus thiocyanatoxydans]|uniref:1-deoxy-D-xylulose-5-phosphate synthase n=1 Tax=Thiohalophilus thiocyanatoxydans TaxID=381308 RepID=A0A4R8ILM2_9GAMM|nr:1-deoxy-D-xylulose-5-phosphate synthase [Thiohalophilus thiocyanatoxydans]TDY01702.1 1-deoxy-D-xylulose-5-phosphate synthase [Thiohalophilus thiocyanatoxydans]
MSDSALYPLLHRIDTPGDLRQFEQPELLPLADELRRFLIESVSRTGGHLAASLGTIELTLALHYVYDTPEDRLVWDVGHQSYPHKILTGRRERMPSLRQKDGLSGFPRRQESEYDTFGVGHSSTSVSAALGMALAARQQQSDRRAVAVIGDGALTAGMAFEALNHAGDMDANMLVILNDNDMSISPNVGGLANHLARILSGRLYASMREGSKKVLSVMPSVWELARRAEEHMKGMVIPGTLFEELGFNYIGPVDGHDLNTLIKTLRNLRQLKGPQFLHIVTKKGKGYPPAEDNPCTYHGVRPFDIDSGKPHAGSPAGGPTYTEVFGQWLCDMAAADERLVGITPAMREGSGLVTFAEQYPDRYFDVGIAEQHAVTLAGGLAADGMKPVLAIYSTFLQRAYDQLIHDIAIQNLPVLFAIDRAGIVGPDGATHAGSFDLSYLRAIPNLTIMAPADENECRQMLSTGFQLNGPTAVRYPRGTGMGVAVEPTLATLEVGRGELRREGKRVAILSFGALLGNALAAAEELDATVANMRFIKPLDTELLQQLAADHDLLVTLEDNAIQGGAGSAVSQWLDEQPHSVRVLHLGLPDEFLEHGSREQLLATAGLDTEGIIRTITAVLGEPPLAKHATLA